MTGASHPAICFDAVTLALGARTVLSDASFEIQDGEFVGLLGPNGAGKTTLMRAILGLTPARRGRITVNGRAARRGDLSIGYMPQNRSLGDLRWTGWDFVASAAGGHRWGWPRLDRAERMQVARALELVDAVELAQRPLREMSGGERQRLLLSQALLGEPSIVLLDEPLISLDPAYQRIVVDLAKRLQSELRATIVFSAHELNPLLNSLDRVLYVGSQSAVLGSVDEVIVGPVLSRLYGAEIEVLRVGGRIFVIDGDHEVESEAHRHDHGHGHDHDGHAAGRRDH